MSEKERKEIKAMVQTAKYLADHDPQGLMLAKATMDILKARSVLENATQEQAQKEAEAPLTPSEQRVKDKILSIIYGENR